jgi:hypothetical protein
MSAVLLALVALVLGVAAALLGHWLRAILPEHHLHADSRDAMKLVLALVASMAALVLGLLVNTSQTVYRSQGENLMLLAANLVTLDRVLLRYGPEAEEPSSACDPEPMRSATTSTSPWTSPWPSPAPAR